MNKSFHQCTAVITGAASGIGRELAIVLARERGDLVLSDINQSGLEKTLELVRQAGGSGAIHICDVSNGDAVKTMADHCFSKWGRVEVLINNAGVAVSGVTGVIPMEDWKWTMAINFWGVLHGCHAFIPRMKQQRRGHILNVASIAGIVSIPEMGPYNASKAAVISLSETLRSELAPANIGVSVLCPSHIKTNLLNNMRYTDEFQRLIANTGFANARITPAEAAEITVRAMKKNRLYIIPQGPAKSAWLFKRLFPAFYFACLAKVTRASWGKRFMLQLNRMGF
ncbi:MAG: SDR family NAD(P)-dependent oxidoreductase [Thermodesulfobacteriota bacterium]